MENFEEKKISTKRAYNGKILNLDVDSVLCPNGRTSTREVVRHRGASCILAINEKNQIAIERQYRYPLQEVLFELPAGKIDEGENPKDAAVREFEEECGYHANDMTLLQPMYPTCGYSDEIIYLYFTKNFTKTETSFDEDEVISTKWIDFEEVLKMISDGKIKDAKTVFAVLAYNLKYNTNK